jgi:hypothetical protein
MRRADIRTTVVENVAERVGFEVVIRTRYIENIGLHSKH